MIIGFCGAAGAGKSTAARRLVDRHGFTLVSFAAPLKRMVLALGLDAEALGQAKEQPHDLLCGRTPRYALQTLGTEWGRNLMGPDFWVRLWAAEAAKYRLVVVDDVRFVNEVEAIRAAGGRVLRIIGPRAALEPAAASHVSERVALEADGDIFNLGEGLGQFWATVDGAAAYSAANSGSGCGSGVSVTASSR